MRKFKTTALLGAAVAALAFAAPAPAVAADNSSKACKAIGNNPDPEGGGTFTHGACVSVFSSGRLRGAAYSSQCRNLAEMFGGYPIVFEGDEGIIGPGTPVAKNHGQCVVILRKLHQAFGA